MMGLSSKSRVPAVLIAAVAASVLMGCREKTKPPTTKPTRATTQPAPTQPGPAWGKATNGLQCRLLPQTQVVQVAHGKKPTDVKVFVTYELRNVGKKLLRFSPWHTPLEDTYGNLMVVGADGNPAQCLLAVDTGKRLRPNDFIELLPGKTHSQRARIWYDLTRPGTYSISSKATRWPAPEGEQIMLYYGRNAAEAKENRDNVWTGRLVSNTVTVKTQRLVPKQWGQAVKGLQAGLAVMGVEMKPQPRVTVLLGFRNTGAKPIRILRLSDRKRFWGDRVPVEVELAGKVLPNKGPALTPPPAPGSRAYIHLAPGKGDSTEAVMLLKYWGLKGPSGAELTFVFINKSATTIGDYDQKTKSWTTVKGLWTGNVRSNTVKLNKGPAAALSARIILPKKIQPTKGTFPAKLELTNNASDPVRLATHCQAWRSSGKGWFDVQFRPDSWKSDAPTIQQSAKSISTLSAGKSVTLPFTVIDGGGKTLQLAASYGTSKGFAKRLNVWSGLVSAERILLQRAANGTFRVVPRDKWPLRGSRTSLQEAVQGGLAFVAAAPTTQPAGAASPVREDIAWGKAADGIRVGLSPKTISLDPGEKTLTVRVWYENVGNEPREVPVHKDTNMYKLMFGGSIGGKPFYVGRLSQRFETIPPRRRSLKAGERFSERAHA